MLSINRPSSPVTDNTMFIYIFILIKYVCKFYQFLMALVGIVSVGLS